ncbi:MAG: hypothetical protein WB555_12090, partial [Candidatus Korobacteraceae bacterium]
EKIEKQIPRRPEGLLVMTKQKTCNGAAEAAPLQNIPPSTFSAARSAGGSVSSATEAAKKVEEQIPRRPEGLLVMTKTKD